MKLEIVSHCWRYGRLLNYQLSSLWLHPPATVQVTVTVFLAEEDEHTRRVVEFFAQHPSPATVVVRPWFLPTPKLMRRAIGRNQAALATAADWVWFADCDYLFGAGALDALVRRTADVEGPLVFPQHVLVQRTHTLGDDAVRRASGPPRLLKVDAAEFKRVRLNRAIGGVQVARGDVVRRLGYCRDCTRFQRAAPRWMRAREDPLFRRILGTPGEAIDVPQVYRLRHSQCGRRTEGLRL